MVAATRCGRHGMAMQVGGWVAWHGYRSARSAVIRHGGACAQGIFPLCCPFIFCICFFSLSIGLAVQRQAARRDWSLMQNLRGERGSARQDQVCARTTLSLLRRSVAVAVPGAGCWVLAVRQVQRPRLSRSVVGGLQGSWSVSNVPYYRAQTLPALLFDGHGAQLWLS